jgi:hypothetical protein
MTHETGRRPENSIRDGPTQLRIDEVVHEHPLGLSFRLVLDPAVVVFANHLLLLGIDADHRLTGGGEGLGLAVQVTELAVTIRMGGALFDLGRADPPVVRARALKMGNRTAEVGPPPWPSPGGDSKYDGVYCWDG